MDYPDVLLHIDGAWTGAASGKTLAVMNPATGEANGTVAHAEQADLDRVWDGHEYSGRRDRTPAELDAVRALRPRLRALLTADLPGAVDQLNRMLAEASAVPPLVRDDRLDWHIHAIDPDEPAASVQPAPPALPASAAHPCICLSDKGGIKECCCCCCCRCCCRCCVRMFMCFAPDAMCGAAVEGMKTLNGGVMAERVGSLADWAGSPSIGTASPKLPVPGA